MTPDLILVSREEWEAAQDSLAWLEINATQSAVVGDAQAHAANVRKILNRLPAAKACLSETSKDLAQADLSLSEDGQACKGCEGRGEIGGFDQGENAWRTERCDYCHGTGIDTGPYLIEPDTDGSFVGDIWFGHPENRTMGTHRWAGSSWEVLPTEMESVLQLLASARAENEKLRQLLVASPSGEFPRLEFLEAMRDCPTAEWGQVAITYSLREAFNYAFGVSPRASPQVQSPQPSTVPVARESAQETLDFLNSIEGHGYGGMACFEIARQNIRALLAKAISPIQHGPRFIEKERR